MNKKRYNKSLKLIGCEAESEARVLVEEKYTDDDGYEVALKLEYGGEVYFVNGVLSYAAAIADLQRSLPEGVMIKSCMSCGYAQQCVFGDARDKVYCSYPGIKPEELISMFDNADYERSAKCAFDCCPNFEFAEERHQNYNDFLPHLKK